MINPLFCANIDLSKPELSAGIRALARLSGSQENLHSIQGQLSPSTTQSQSVQHFVVSPDIVYGVAACNRDFQEQQDEIERTAITQLDLNTRINLSPEVIGFPITEEEISDIALMTYEVPPRHWIGFLWNLFGDKERAMIVLEELKISISSATGITTNEAVMFF
ncbi:hypothetical protein M407DRAFT_247164, partial [Tulasnella calospora MUT 4182]